MGMPPQQEALFNKLEEGQLVEGVVRSVQPYGAFVDVGGIQGLLHISQISHHYAHGEAEVFFKQSTDPVIMAKDKVPMKDEASGHYSWSPPRVVLAKGQRVAATVLKKDGANGRFSLSTMVREVGLHNELLLQAAQGSGAILIRNLDECRAATLHISNVSHAQTPPRRLALAVENEGKNISLLQIAMEVPGAGASRGLDKRYRVYVFDVATLQKEAFAAPEEGGGGLGEILQSEDIQKVVLDVARLRGATTRGGDPFMLGNVRGLMTSNDAAQRRERLVTAIRDQSDLDEADKGRVMDWAYFAGRKNDHGSRLWARPLQPDILEYAASNARYLIPLADLELR